MPNVISPEFLFTDKNSRSIMDKIKVNLDNLCEKERNVNLRTIFYKSKFIIEIKDLCRLELAQIRGINFSDSA